MIINLTCLFNELFEYVKKADTFYNNFCRIVHNCNFYNNLIIIKNLLYFKMSSNMILIVTNSVKLFQALITLERENILMFSHVNSQVSFFWILFVTSLVRAFVCWFLFYEFLFFLNLLLFANFIRKGKLW
jgi:hypothetical protein